MLPGSDESIMSEETSKNPEIDGFTRWIWLGDLSHLVLLLCATWTMLYAVFLRVEPQWPRLVGFG